MIAAIIAKQKSRLDQIETALIGSESHGIDHELT